jgi:histidinol-phosphate/aromatic aminotransferase/cobyric acid decarboxylase-like protein
MITRMHVGDYDAWRPMFDQDRPRAREKATAVRVLRNVDDPDHVFVFVEFASVEDAHEARRRVLDSGVLDRFADKHGPNVVVDAAASADS